MDKLESDLESFVRLCHLYEKVETLEKALAEKDREIEAKETELGKLDAELIIRNAAYQQLMEKAVWFARQLGVERVSGGLSYIEYPERAQDFLASPEVQAWKEQQG